MIIKENVQFAQKALIIKDGKLLMIKKSDKDLVNPNRYEVPGGRKEPGETIDEQMINKVKGEVGLDIVPGELFDIWEFKIKENGKFLTIIAVSRFCHLLNGDVSIVEEDIDKYEWVEINEEMLSMDLIPGIRPTIEKLVKKYNGN